MSARQDAEERIAKAAQSHKQTEEELTRLQEKFRVEASRFREQLGDWKEQAQAAEAAKAGAEAAREAAQRALELANVKTTEAEASRASMRSELEALTQLVKVAIEKNEAHLQSKLRV